jgi:hypothetical protein
MELLHRSIIVHKRDSLPTALMKSFTMSHILRKPGYYICLKYLSLCSSKWQSICLIHLSHICFSCWPTLPTLTYTSEQWKWCLMTQNQNTFISPSSPQSEMIMGLVGLLPQWGGQIKRKKALRETDTLGEKDAHMAKCTPCGHHTLLSLTERGFYWIDKEGTGFINRL